ncbi:EF-hand domain-containing protein [archaeon]|nr:MAG: EF-hand domain-containing protein [archaeon]
MLPGGKEVRISNLEMAAMRAIFDLFDLTGTGTISATELQRLHEKLGEPITDDEAHHAVADIGRGRDHITFEEYVCAPARAVHTVRGRSTHTVRAVAPSSRACPAALHCTGTARIPRSAPARRRAQNRSAMTRLTRQSAGVSARGTRRASSS